MECNSKDKVESFLEKRMGRLALIEMAVFTFKEIGEGISHNKFLESTESKLDNYDIGCIYQFFAFSQKLMVDCIFTQFIAIIGNHDSKRDVLKAWEKIEFSNIDKTQEYETTLKQIRERYQEARHNLICHINDDYTNTSASVLTSQIIEDIEKLKEIFNDVRKANGLPLRFSAFNPSESYQTMGAKKALALIFGNTSNN